MRIPWELNLWIYPGNADPAVDVLGLRPVSPGTIDSAQADCVCRWRGPGSYTTVKERRV
jgi:hypothetical protein